MGLYNISCRNLPYLSTRIVQTRHTVFMLAWTVVVKLLPVCMDGMHHVCGSGVRRMWMRWPLRSLFILIIPIYIYVDGKIHNGSYR